MEHLTTVRLELGINAQKFMQQVMINNAKLEDQIEKGITLALDELSKEDTFVMGVKNETLKQLNSIVSQHILSWELRNKLAKSIEEKIGQKLNEYADQIATKIVEALK